jgi:phage FluMu gp28-like protein
MRGKLIKDNDYSIELDNGSFAKATATSDEAGRSEGLSLLLLDEAAFIKNMDSIWTAAHMTLAEGGKCIALSTPNGVGNWFHTTFTMAETGENNFKAITLPWYVHPNRDQAWRDNENIEAGDKKTAAQENDCSFITSGESVIDGELIKKYEDRIKGVGEFEEFERVVPLEESGPNNKLWV